MLQKYEYYHDQTQHNLKKNLFPKHRTSSSIQTSEFLTSSTLLFNGSDVFTKIDSTFTGTREQFWPDVLPATTNDSYRYERELNQGHWVQVRHLNHWVTAAVNTEARNKYNKLA